MKYDGLFRPEDNEIMKNKGRGCGAISPAVDPPTKSSRRPLAVVVLAGGKGTRMKSSIHKMLQPLAGRPMLEYVLMAVSGLSPERTVVVVGHDAEAVSARFRKSGISFAYQSEQLGTGHALLQSYRILKGFGGDILVVNGDAPLITTGLLRRLYRHHLVSQGNMSLLTFCVKDPNGFGRIFRKSDGRVSRIIEHKDCDVETLGIHEVNTGLYVFDYRVFDLAQDISNSNHAGEYLITDLVQLYTEGGYKVEAVKGAGSVGVALGVNDRSQLVEAEKVLRHRIRQRWLKRGVTFADTKSITIDDTVSIGRAVELGAKVKLLGTTSVGDLAQVGAHSELTDCEVIKGAEVPCHTVAKNEKFDS